MSQSWSKELGGSPLCHWPSARAAVEGPTAGAQGRLAHMAVFFSLELLAGSPSKTSSTIPTTPAPSPASYATQFSPPHSFPPRRVLRGARALAGCSEQCVLCFPPRGKCREPAWGSLGAWRSEDKTGTSESWLSSSGKASLIHAFPLSMHTPDLCA